MEIPVTAGIRGFAGIPNRDFTLNLVIKTCQKIKNFQQKFNKKHVKFNTDFKLKVVIFFTQYTMKRHKLQMNNYVVAPKITQNIKSR